MVIALWMTTNMSFINKKLIKLELIVEFTTNQIFI